MQFEEAIQRASQVNKTKTVLALDLQEPDPVGLLKKATTILQNVSPYICAVKINRQLVLSLGLHKGVGLIVRQAHELSLPAIMDAKLNDVAHTNEFMMRSYIEAGFDAVIASPISGWEGGLDRVFEVSRANGKAVLLLVYMSNPGAQVFYSLNVSQGRSPSRPIYELLTEMANEWKADGVVVGATKPNIIARIRELVGPSMAIFSPGVGAQGGDVREAVAAGSNYLIIGRSIYDRDDPAGAAKMYRDQTI